MTFQFDLTTENWIPASSLETGQVQEYSVRELLANAHHLGEIYDASPLVTVSLMRTLLALLYRALPVSDYDQWQQVWEAGRFPTANIEAYLNKWQNRFDLFSEKYPFYQAAGLHLEKCDGLSRLAEEQATGNNSTLFDHTLDETLKAYTPAQAARLVVAAQSFSFAGLIRREATLPDESPFYWGSCYNAVLLPGVTLWLNGDTLFQTLMLNLVPPKSDEQEDDAPIWEEEKPHRFRDRMRDGRKSLVYPAQGPMDRFTWQSRLLRLVPEQHGEATVVRQVCYTQGRSADLTDNSFDPMQAFRRNKTEGMSPVRLAQEKAAWRDAHALMGVSDTNNHKPRAFRLIATLIQNGVIEPGRRYQLNVVGMANDQAKVYLWRHDRMTIPASLLNDEERVAELKGLIEQAEEWEAGKGKDRQVGMARQIRENFQQVCELYLSPNYRDRDGKPNPSGRKPDTKDISRLTNALDPRRAYWARLETHFQTLLLEMAADPSGAAERWLDAIESEARCAFQEAVHSLGETTRAQQAVARVYTRFQVASRRRAQAT